MEIPKDSSCNDSRLALQSHWEGRWWKFWFLVRSWRQWSAGPERTLRIYILQVAVSPGGKDLWLSLYFHLALTQSPGDWSTSQAAFIYIVFLSLAIDAFLSEFCFFLRSKAPTSSEEISPLQPLWLSKPLLWSKWVLVRNVFFQLTFYFCLYVFEKALHLRKPVFVWQ